MNHHHTSQNIFPLACLQQAGTGCGNFKGVNTQSETQLHLQHPSQCHLIHLLGPHHQGHASLFFPDCLRTDVMHHKCPSPAPCGASTEPILHPHVIILSLVFGQPKVLQIRTCLPEGCGHRIEEVPGTGWQNDMGMNQKVGTLA